MSLHKSKHGCVTQQIGYGGLGKAFILAKENSNLIVRQFWKFIELRHTPNFSQIKINLKKILRTGGLRRLRVQEHGAVRGRDNVWK